MGFVFRTYALRLHQHWHSNLRCLFLEWSLAVISWYLPQASFEADQKPAYQHTVSVSCESKGSCGPVAQTCIDDLNRCILSSDPCCTS